MKISLISALFLSLLLCIALSLAALAGGDCANKDLSGKDGVVKMFVNVEGMGIVQCEHCVTSQGCNCFWIQSGTKVECYAKAVEGSKFRYWTMNGNYVANHVSMRFPAKDGATIGALFK